MPLKSALAITLLICATTTIFCYWAYVRSGNAVQAATTFNGVLTYHNDNMRSGRNMLESVLTWQNVNAATFGKLFVIATDGKVDAQPLFRPDVKMGNVAHNVLYVATEHDTVYAFDGDTGANLWQVSLLQPGETPSDNRGCGQVTPVIGITATPVIDPTSGPNGTIYVVAMSKDVSGRYYQRLHALDLTTGREEFGGPVTIQAKFPGTGDNSRGGYVIFDPKQYKERPGLLLLNHTIYTFWSSHCDYRPYTGWVISYNESSLSQQAVLNITPNGNAGAIWSSGGAPAADSAANIYLLAGNGTFDTTLNANGFPRNGDCGNCFLKLSTTNHILKIADYFTMYNTVAESNADEDLGSGGAMVLPGIKDSRGVVHYLAVGAGKDRNIYMVDRNNLGKFNASNNYHLYQELPGALGGSEFAMPAFFGSQIYYGAAGDVIREFGILNAKLTAPVSHTAHVFPYPGTTPSLSSNGASDAVLWAAENTSTAVLHAYKATNLAVELYNSNQASGGRDHFGRGNKFITPTIANGRVYVATTNGVGVFGLL